MLGACVSLCYIFFSFACSSAIWASICLRSASLSSSTHSIMSPGCTFKYVHTIEGQNFSVCPSNYALCLCNYLTYISQNTATKSLLNCALDTNTTTIKNQNSPYTQDSAIKVIKRNAFGYRNFMNFRNRILMSLT